MYHWKELTMSSMVGIYGNMTSIFMRKQNGIPRDNKDAGGKKNKDRMRKESTTDKKRCCKETIFCLDLNLIFQG